MIQIPPKSIVINTHEILSACEIAEVMNHHQEMTSDDNNTTTTTSIIPTISQIAVRIILSIYVYIYIPCHNQPTNIGQSIHFVFLSEYYILKLFLSLSVCIDDSNGNIVTFGKLYTCTSFMASL